MSIIRAHGRVVSVDTVELGSQLTADTAAAAASLVVVNATDFPSSGTLVINGQSVDYTAVDDPTGAITLAGTLPAAASEGDAVSLWDAATGATSTEKRALVQFDGDEGSADPVLAVVAQSLIRDIDDGIRDIGESVLLEHEHGLWRIIDVLGTASAQVGSTQFYQDAATATGPGNLPIALSYLPVDNSEHVYWGGLYQPGSQWTRSGQVVTLTDPDGWLQSGDVCTVEYAYRPGLVLPVVVTTTLVDWGSTGRYKVVAEGDMTDYSASSLDDSGWASGPAPVGSPLGGNAGQPSWPGVVTSSGSVNSGFWLRRAVTLSSPALLSIQARVDGQWWVYCDGTLVASDPSGNGTAALGPLSASVGAGSHVLALHVNDDTLDPVSENIYGDLYVEAN